MIHGDKGSGAAVGDIKVRAPLLVWDDICPVLFLTSCQLARES